MSNTAHKKQEAKIRTEVNGHFMSRRDNVFTPYQMFINKVESMGIRVQIAPRSYYPEHRIEEFEAFPDAVILKDPSPEAILQTAKRGMGVVSLIICVVD